MNHNWKWFWSRIPWDRIICPRDISLETFMTSCSIFCGHYANSSIDGTVDSPRTWKTERCNELNSKIGHFDVFETRWRVLIFLNTTDEQPWDTIKKKLFICRAWLTDIPKQWGRFVPTTLKMNPYFFHIYTFCL